jgi:DNA topoisomerase-1
MAKNLLIVESPAKAKTIGSYLGDDFLVKSSFGHIRDLVKGNHAVKVEEGYAATYAVPEDKKAMVAELRKLAAKADLVWLASDEDREGEAIAWHLQEVLDLKESKIRRIVFHEITKPAITKAVAHPRHIDKDLVMAQQARRILDRLVGFELSPLLWRKVKPSLSAGRVQSVAVRILVDREREISAFEPQAAFRVNGWFHQPTNHKAIKTPFKTELNRRFDHEEEVGIWLQKAVQCPWSVRAVEKKPVTKSPSAPFTTSTLQQEASRKLRYGVTKTMRVAQRLYEAGHITYMRTDSVNLSETALEGTAQAILGTYGEPYYHRRQFKTKSAGAQEAHEAIRPTDFAKSKLPELEKDQQALYELIWKRTVASQMAEAKLEKTRINLNTPDLSEEFIAEGEVLLFDGFLKLYLESADEEEQEGNEDNPNKEIRLPALQQGDITPLDRLLATQRYSRPPSRYTEASLVKKLEELGIGRPSTYAPTIGTIQDRGYVERTELEGMERSYIVLEQKPSAELLRQTLKEITGADKNKLRPTDIGMLVNDFLLLHFPEVMDFGFTAKVEEDFDRIADGKLDWTKMLDAFYRPFHQTVTKATEESERVNGERELGMDGAMMYSVRMARYGPVVARLNPLEPDAKPQYAKLKAGMIMEQLNLADALELFRLPRTLGEYQDQVLTVGAGRFGPYIKWGDMFVSIPKEDDPLTLTTEKAVELILAKQAAAAARLLKDFPDSGIQMINGRWGPFLTRNGENYRIPKGAEWELADEAQCVQWIEQSPPSKPSRFGAKSKSNFSKTTFAKPAPKPTSSKPAGKTSTSKPAKKSSSSKPAGKTSTSKQVAKTASPKSRTKTKS